MGLLLHLPLLLLLFLLLLLIILLLLLLITSFFMYISAAIRDLYGNDRSSDHSNASYLYCGSIYDCFRKVIILLHSLTFYSVFFLLLLFPLWLELYCTVLYCTLL